MNRSISTILFDLGRVLIELDGPPPLKDEWLPSPITLEEKWRRWGESEYVRAYEAGKISSEEFISGVLAEQKLSVDFKGFKAAFECWPKAFLPGAEHLLRELKPNFSLAFYSNTSDLHLPRIMKDIGLNRFFDFAFASYEIGFVKPDLKGFEYVIKALKQEPNNILFMDDNMLNVLAARKLGLNAELVVGVDQVRKVLADYSCI